MYEWWQSKMAAKPSMYYNTISQLFHVTFLAIRISSNVRTLVSLYCDCCYIPFEAFCHSSFSIYKPQTLPETCCRTNSSCCNWIFKFPDNEMSLLFLVQCNFFHIITIMWWNSFWFCRNLFGWILCLPILSFLLLCIILLLL